MKITSRGQVTIPIGIRQKFGLLPGTEVALEGRGGVVVIRKVRESGRRDAHAAVSGLALLTRDAARYRTYFPRLEVISP